MICCTVSRIFLRSVAFVPCYVFLIFFFNDTATTEIYTLSLHDALPIWIMKSRAGSAAWRVWQKSLPRMGAAIPSANASPSRSEEHTSELQSLRHLVCRLLLEKKKKIKYIKKQHTDTKSQHHINTTHVHQ